MTEAGSTAESTSLGPFTVGVEEEYLVLDAATYAPFPDGERLLQRAKERFGDAVQKELHRTQLEVSTSVCEGLSEVRAELRRLRRDVAAIAESVGATIAASGTHPLAVPSEDGGVTPTEAYLRLERDYQQLAREQLICGCHVHVGIADPELAIQVVNRVRPYLSVVLALAANSPFWAGADTGYASYRTEIWQRWPTSGTPDLFDDRAAYEALVRDLLDTGSIDAPARLYWDVRPSARFSTVEFRVSDVCLRVDDAVMVVGLVRGLARACAMEAAAGAPLPRPRPELLRAATWRAARFGVEADLVDVLGVRSVPAPDAVRGLLDVLRPGLEDAGEWDELVAMAESTLAGGTGAARQRAAFEQGGNVRDVLQLVVEQTVDA